VISESGSARALTATLFERVRLNVRNAFETFLYLSYVAEFQQNIIRSMSLFTILSLGSAFLNVAHAGQSDDVKHALYVLKDLPKDLAEPYCSKLGTSGKGAKSTVTEAQYTITTTLGCSETGGYGSEPWNTKVRCIQYYKRCD
jgi:hypothetical protein